MDEPINPVPGEETPPTPEPAKEDLLPLEEDDAEGDEQNLGTDPDLPMGDDEQV